MSEESKNGIRDLLRNPISGFVAAFLIIGIGLFLNIVQEKIGWQMLLATAGTALACFAFITWILVRYYAAPLSRFREDFLDKVDHYKDSKIIDWLLTTTEMVDVEVKTGAPEIWVVSPNLSEDMPGGPFCEVVRGNLTKGRKYVYFVPDSDEMQTKVEQLKKYHKNSANLLVVHLGEDSFFFLVAGLDVTIYNPRAEKGAKKIMYLGIPSDDGETHQYQVRTNPTFADRLVGKLKKELRRQESS